MRRAGRGKGSCQKGKGVGQMIKLWDIRLYLKKTGRYQAIIIDETGKKTTGTGRTPHLAYSEAEAKRVIKPWLKSEG